MSHSEYSLFFKVKDGGSRLLRKFGYYQTRRRHIPHKKNLHIHRLERISQSSERVWSCAYSPDSEHKEKLVKFSVSSKMLPLVVVHAVGVRTPYIPLSLQSISSTLRPFIPLSLYLHLHHQHQHYLTLFLSALHPILYWSSAVIGQAN